MADDPQSGDATFRSGVNRLEEDAPARVDVDRQTLRAIVARTPVDAELADDLAALRAGEEEVGDPRPESRAARPYS